MIGMLRMMRRVGFGVMLSRMLMMLGGMQVVALRQLTVMGRRVIVAFVVSFMSFAMMMRGRFEMMGGFLVMIVLRHCRYSPF